MSDEQRYVLHFAKDQLPPARALWSLTLNRYALGDRDDLHYNADGSLDLYIQHDQPDASEQRRNRLSAPKGRFNLFLHLYWPQPEVLQKRWLPPTIQLAHNEIRFWPKVA